MYAKLVEKQFLCFLMKQSQRSIVSLSAQCQEVAVIAAFFLPDQTVEKRQMSTVEQGVYWVYKQ